MNSRAYTIGGGGRRDRRGRGFTLAELIVASVILALVLGATTVSVSQMLRARDRASAAGEAFSRAELAATRIAADAQVALRDADLQYGKLAITTGGPAGRTAQGLLLFTHQNRSVRNDTESPESDEYEVQYRLEPATVVAPDAPALFTLWRRADPVPDDAPDGGGIASPVVDGLTALSFEAYDGSQWLTAWDSDADGYPHALRIVVTASDDRGRRSVTARRLVAVDRVPLPLPAEEEETDGSNTEGTQ